MHEDNVVKEIENKRPHFFNVQYMDHMYLAKKRWVKCEYFSRAHGIESQLLSRDFFNRSSYYFSVISTSPSFITRKLAFRIFTGSSTDFYVSIASSGLTLVSHNISKFEFSLFLWNYYSSYLS